MKILLYVSRIKSPENTLPLKQLLIRNANLKTSAKENFSQSYDWTRVFSQSIFSSTFCVVKYNWKETNELQTKQTGKYYFASARFLKKYFLVSNRTDFSTQAKGFYHKS